MENKDGQETTIIQVPDTLASQTLEQAPLGYQGIVQGLNIRCPHLREKLASLGVVAGSQVSLRHVAPLGCPLAVEVLGSMISLRKAEAQGVLVSK